VTGGESAAEAGVIVGGGASPEFCEHAALATTITATSVL
jgi:hypothetical protein